MGKHISSDGLFYKGNWKENKMNGSGVVKYPSLSSRHCFGSSRQQAFDCWTSKTFLEVTALAVSDGITCIQLLCLMVVVFVGVGVLHEMTNAVKMMLYFMGLPSFEVMDSIFCCACGTWPP